jgi:hypothetical protein
MYKKKQDYMRAYGYGGTSTNRTNLLDYSMNARNATTVNNSLERD